VRDVWYDCIELCGRLSLYCPRVCVLPEENGCHQLLCCSLVWGLAYLLSSSSYWPWCSIFGYDPLKPTIITVLLLIFLLVILLRIHKILDNFRLIPHDKDRIVAPPGWRVSGVVRLFVRSGSRIANLSFCQIAWSRPQRSRP